MSNISHDYIEDYIRGLLPQRTGTIGEIEREAVEGNVPIIHPEVAQFLRVLIKANGVKKILEVGTAVGYSGGIMLEAAGQGAELVTIERSDEMADRAKENFARLGMENNVTLLKGEALELLAEELSAGDRDGSFDLVFLDAAKGHYGAFLAHCLKLLKPGGLLVCDNVLFRGMVAGNHLLIRRKITIVKRMRKYLTQISAMPTLETVVLPIGDGIAFSTKLGEE